MELHRKPIIGGEQQVLEVRRSLSWVKEELIRHSGIDIMLRVCAHLMPGDDGKLPEAANRLFG